MKDVKKEILLRELEKYKVLYEHSPLPYQSLDVNGKILDVNPAWLNFLGYEKKEVIGKNIADFIHPDYLFVLKEQFSKLLKQGYIHDAQFKLRHKSGKYIYISNSGNLSYTPDGKIKQTHCVFKDITEQKLNEVSIKKSEEEFKNLLEDLPVGVVIHQKFKIVYCNRKIIEILEADDKNDVLNRSIINFLPKENIKQVYTQIKSVIAGLSHLLPYETRYLTRKKNIIDTEVIAKPIVFNSKPAVLLIGSDISRRKRIENEINQKNKEFETLTEAAGDALFVSDFETERFIFVNKQACQSLGYTKKELLQLKVSDIDPVFVNKDYKKTLWEKMTPGTNVTIEAFHKRKDGSIFPVEIRTGLFDFNGKKAVLGFARDASERKKIEKELETYREGLEKIIEERTKEILEKSIKLEKSQKAMMYLIEDVNEARKDLDKKNKLLTQANSDLESFTYTVSHDLKMPLRAIALYTELISDKLSDIKTPEIQQFIEHIFDNIKNMKIMIDDLIQFARTGNKELIIQKIDLSQLVQDTFRQFSQKISNQNIEIEIEKNVFAYADIVYLKQIISNLLNNALKYSDKNRKNKITFGKLHKNGNEFFYIKDQGIGFDMKYHDEIFLPFKRLHKNSEYEGSGIGLATVKKMIEKHGGTVFAESEPGTGTVFFFTLPGERKNN